MKIIMYISMYINIMFTQTKKPMNIVMMILIQTAMMTFMMSLKTNSPWFPYLLMIIFIGGMMVTFIYITSIMPNDNNRNNPPMMIMITIMMITIIITVNNTKSYINNNEIIPMNEVVMSNANNYTLNKMFNKPMHLLYITTTMYLFITLIAISNISNIKMGPLRKMIN
nr:NADH dehydrogenase subunit 6 [Scelimena sp. 1 JL-2023a]